MVRVLCMCVEDLPNKKSVTNNWTTPTPPTHTHTCSKNKLFASYKSLRQLEKFFWSVTRHGENLPDRHTKKKSLFVVFLTKKDPFNDLTWRETIQKVRKWRLVVKFSRENVRDVRFLNVFNQANYKYTPKKDFQLLQVFVFTCALKTLWNDIIRKSFFGVSYVRLRICVIDTRRKSHFLLLLVNEDT